MVELSSGPTAGNHARAVGKLRTQLPLYRTDVSGSHHEHSLIVTGSKSCHPDCGSRLLQVTEVKGQIVDGLAIDTARPPSSRRWVRRIGPPSVVWFGTCLRLSINGDVVASPLAVDRGIPLYRPAAFIPELDSCKIGPFDPDAVPRSSAWWRAGCLEPGSLTGIGGSKKSPSTVRTSRPQPQTSCPTSNRSDRMSICTSCASASPGH